MPLEEKVRKRERGDARCIALDQNQEIHYTREKNFKRSETYINTLKEFLSSLVNVIALFFLRFLAFVCLLIFIALRGF